VRERLKENGALPISEAARLVAEVVDALAHAHARGVVHRDIKPENVMLSGRHALVTDFGVAKALSDATAKDGLTTRGVALGTPAYMSPEQATAEPGVDHRADIYAVGALAYELLAGRPPFVGPNAQRVLAAQVTEPPAPLSRYRPEVPEALERVVMKCLAKQADERWQSAEEILAQLEPLALTGGATPARMPRFLRPATPRTAALLAGGALVAVAAGASLIPRDRKPPVVLGQATPITADPGIEIHPCVSPDGKFVAYAAGTARKTRIFLQPIAGGRAIPLTDGPPALHHLKPRWSLDGSSILYLAGSAAFVVPALGGTPRQVLPAGDFPVRTAVWSPDGRAMAFVRHRSDTLFVRSLDGTSIRAVAVAPELHSCDWSPRGDLIACVSGNADFDSPAGRFGNIAPSRVVSISVVSGSARSVSDTISGNLSPAWDRNGRWLYYVSNRHGPRDIYARAISARGHPQGEPVRLTTGLNAQSIGLSADGRHLAYSVWTQSSNIWAIPIPSVPRVSAPPSVTLASGQTAAVPLTTGRRIVGSPQVSPDRRWVYYHSDLRGSMDLYRVPTDGGEPEQLTRDPDDEFAPAASPGGREVSFHSFRTGSRDIFVMLLDGGPAQQVTKTPAHEQNAVWSPDGRSLAYYVAEEPAVYVVRRDAAGRWQQATRRMRGIQAPAWSPDGRLLLVTTPGSPSRAPELVVLPVDSGEARTVYPGPRWSGAPQRLAGKAWGVDGRSIYFMSRDTSGANTIWKVALSGGQPRPLVRFDDPVLGALAADDKRFFVTIREQQSDVWVIGLVTRR
jgi:Tol biopolymer transport system component